MENINSIVTLLSIILACASIIITILIYCRRFKDEQLKELARQIIAYYAEEQEAIKWIQSTGDSRAPKTIQTELRDRAAKNDRGNGERPEYTPNRVSNFL